MKTKSKQRDNSGQSFDSSLNQEGIRGGVEAVAKLSRRTCTYETNDQARQAQRDR